MESISGALLHQEPMSSKGRHINNFNSKLACALFQLLSICNLQAPAML